MRRLSLALLPLLLVACSERTPTEAADDGPAFNFMNNPDVGNFKVYRGQANTAVCWTDPGNGLRACHRTTPYGAVPQECDLQAPGDPADYQEVVVDDDIWRILLNAVGDVFITVRDTNMPGDCYNQTLVANGWGRFHINDNDELGVGESSTNSVGFGANGDLEYAVGGDLAKYSGHLRQLASAKKGYKGYTAQVNLH